MDNRSFSTEEIEGELPGRLYRIMHQPGDEDNVRWLVELSYRFAQAYLTQKYRRTYKYSRQLQLSQSQMCWDCIADMFRRDEEGRFPEFYRYFGDLPLYTIEAAEVVSHFRGFVCNHVNDRIFELLREHHPELGKLVRNLKSAVRSSPRVYLTRYEGSSWVVPGDEQEPGKQACIMPPEHLEARLVNRAYHAARAPELLDSCLDILEEADYSSSYPVIGLASVIHLLRQRKFSEDVESLTVTHDADVKDILDRAVENERIRLYESYVGRGKVRAETYNLYFQCIRELFQARYSNGRFTADSLFNRLRARLPGLTRSDYASSHKNLLEYLYRNVTSRMEFFVKNEE